MLRQDEGEATAFLRATEIGRNLYTDVTLDTGTVPSGGYWAVFLGPLIEEKKKHGNTEIWPLSPFHLQGTQDSSQATLIHSVPSVLGIAVSSAPPPSPTAKQPQYGKSDETNKKGILVTWQWDAWIKHLPVSLSSERGRATKEVTVASQRHWN